MLNIVKDRAHRRQKMGCVIWFFLIFGWLIVLLIAFSYGVSPWVMTGIGAVMALIVLITGYISDKKEERQCQK